MKKIAIIYYSKNGTTHKLAEHVAKGVMEADIAPLLYQIKDEDIEQGRFKDNAIFESLRDCTAIIFGCPTYMGSVPAQFKAFIDASSPEWVEQRWVNKLAAGFTIGGSIGGDLHHTINYLQVLATQHSMLWCGLDRPDGSGTDEFNRFSGQTGVMAAVENGDGPIQQVDLKTAHHLGKRVATLASRFNQ
ncbi:flavodoxin [Veronia nyctiphanis]|uniref:Flavodoxin n=1 Tax=Veronia nyctiphanis TaxID=1278244 RepID=A0A4Q0YRL3_9GAMM|nr:flavodoxin family protein [Veronia nyctiphanis]RXJ73756.1 flavodoxin [Veronia nyctiphanis]